MAKTNRKTIDMVFIFLGAASVAVLVVIGGLSWYAYRFATNEVRTQLTAQQIYFPSKGSPALNPAEFPALQQYAGQLVDNGPKAKAYADDFIAVHLSKVAGGKTYSQVSTLAAQNPTNAQLQQQKQTLFQGETLRGLLLGDGYAYWTFGTIAEYAALAAFVGAAVMAMLTLLGLRHLRALK